MVLCGGDHRPDNSRSDRRLETRRAGCLSVAAGVSRVSGRCRRRLGENTESQSQFSKQRIALSIKEFCLDNLFCFNDNIPAGPLCQLRPGEGGFQPPFWIRLNASRSSA